MKLASNIFSILAVVMIFLLAGCAKPIENQLVQPAQPLTPANENGMALLYVAGVGNIAVARNLLDQGVDVNFQGKDHNTPIMEAAFAGHLEMVKLLLDHGAHLSARKNDGETPITLGAAHPEVSELFRNVSALVGAAAKGDDKRLKEFIAKGIPVNGIDESGQSALSESCWNGHANTVKLLLENGANPRIKKPDGETPVNLAAGQKHPDIVALLNEAIARQSPPQAK